MFDIKLAIIVPKRIFIEFIVFFVEKKRTGDFNRHVYNCNLEVVYFAFSHKDNTNVRLFLSINQDPKHTFNDTLTIFIVPTYFRRMKCAN